MSKIKLKPFIIKSLDFIWEKTPNKIREDIYDLGLSFYYHRQKEKYHEDIPKNGIQPEKYLENKRKLKKRNKLKGNPKVTIILPTMNKASLLRACLKGIKKNTLHKNYEIIIINNNTFEKDAINILKKVKHRIVDYSYKFNFSKANNRASKFAKGEYLVFLNNDTVPQKGWLTAMLEECQRKDVGVVGSKLIFPNKTIQHAGIYFDEVMNPSHAFLKKPPDYPPANEIRECDAVTGACLMIKKSLFKKIKGFDEDYWVDSQDVDLCFKARKAGFKTVYTPYSVLTHHELVTRGPVDEDVAIHDTSILLKRKWVQARLIKNLIKNKESKATSSLKVVVVSLMSLGDIIITIPVAEAIKKKYPSCHLSFATSEDYAELLEGNKFIDKIYYCKKFNPKKLSCRKYYKIITKELLTGTQWDKFYKLSLHDTPFGYWQTNNHMSELYANLADVSVKNIKPLIKINSLDNKIARGFIRKHCKKNKKIILIQTTAGWDLKNWDFKKIQMLADKLKKDFNVIHIGSKKDYSIKGVPAFIGKSLKQLSALIKRSDLLITPDSGPMHMACALDKPVVSLFGPTSPPTGGPLWGNYICIQSDACCDDPCHNDKCSKKKGFNCTKEIMLKDVLKAANKMINRKKGETIQETWWAGKIYSKNAKKIFNGSRLTMVISE